MKKVMLVITLFLCVALLFACSASNTPLTQDKVQEIKQLYRSAGNIITAKCSGFSNDGENANLTVIKDIAGVYLKDTIICKNTKFETDAEYLLFLNEPEENSSNMYSDKNYTSMKIEDGGIVWENETYSMNDMLTRINALNEVISIPAMTYYYEKTDSFLKNSDIVVIGRVREYPELTKTKLRSQTVGASIENIMPCTRIKIEVIGNLYGDKKNNDMLTMVYMPDVLSSMTDESTLSTVSMQQNDVITLNTSDYYVFFLAKSPDKKQSYVFPINPIQGWVRLKQNDLVYSKNNNIMQECDSLPKLISGLKQNKR